MIKEKTIKRNCSVLHSEVVLELAANENDQTGFESPSMISACDSCHRCGVKTNSQTHWERCVFYGKEL